ncbi:LysR family transcriptional regulator [Nocardia crassostreae]|uniref:LysR family transcriptional regulator n=1 Tax=Nocardia crassostreae TaxID=53428 RepID=UPI000834A70F|nr:LysR family transcriptional regulator [Nocardia crassostreae]
MNTRLLESFLAVAEERNITRAAARLHITQQTLSAQIRHLERDLSAVLLVRDSRGVQLTAAGLVLAEGARRVVTDLRVLAEQVRAAADAASDTLRIVGCPRTTAPLMIRIADAVEAATPGVRVELISVRTVREGVRILDSGRGDAGLMWAPVAETGLHHNVIGADPWVAAVATGHRLAARATVALADLAADPVVLPAIFVSDAAERDWIAELRPAGTAEPTVRDSEDGPILAARRQAIWLAPRSMGRGYANDGVHLLPVSDAKPIDVVTVWTDQAPQRPMAALREAVHAAVH